jgi:type IX secretion system PorP/SprF family membrane protein
MRRLMTTVLLVAINQWSVNAQVDPHFSQYYVYPSWLNPALTGAIDGDFRISGIYRSQWNSIDNAFATAGISGDVVTGSNLNFGASIMQQRAGTGGYKYLTGYLSVAYTGMRFDAEGYKRLVFGLQGGLVNRGFDKTKFQLGDQWNPITGYNPSTITTDQFTETSSTVFDAGAGLMYYDATPNQASNLFAGFSASHLTRPEDPFTNGPSKARLPVRYTVHGGIKLNLSETFTLVPNGLYLKQGTAEEKMIGAYAQIKGSDFFDFLVGANYRFNDAVAPLAGFYYKNMTMGFSYDVNASDLGKNINNASSFELSMSYTFRKGKQAAGRNFVCPRL